MAASLRLVEPLQDSGFSHAVGHRSRLAVVIVTYNSAEVLPGLLDSLSEGLEGIPSYEVIVVDNDSHDDSVEIAANHPIRARVIQTGRNLGYAAGINAATATIGPEVDLLVLNPDIRLHSGSIRRMYSALRDPTIGIVVPLIFNDDGSVCTSIRREPTMISSWAQAFLGGVWAARVGLGEIVSDPDLYASGGRIDWASGAIMLISHAARKAVGDWDESFFLYSEEVDYFQRVRAAELGVTYVAEAKVMHIGGDYMRNNFLTALMTTNQIKYFRRHHNALASGIFQLGIIVGATMRLPMGTRHRAVLKAALGL